jgi:hypothetical protein
VCVTAHYVANSHRPYKVNFFNRDRNLAALAFALAANARRDVHLRYQPATKISPLAFVSFGIEKVCNAKVPCGLVTSFTALSVMRCVLVGGVSP